MSPVFRGSPCGRCLQAHFDNGTPLSRLFCHDPGEIFLKKKPGAVSGPETVSSVNNTGVRAPPQNQKDVHCGSPPRHRSHLLVSDLSSRVYFPTSSAPAVSFAFPPVRNQRPPLFVGLPIPPPNTENPESLGRHARSCGSPPALKLTSL